MRICKIYDSGAAAIAYAGNRLCVFCVGLHIAVGVQEPVVHLTVCILGIFLGFFGEIKSRKSKSVNSAVRSCASRVSCRIRIVMSVSAHPRKPIGCIGVRPAVRAYRHIVVHIARGSRYINFGYLEGRLCKNLINLRTKIFYCRSRNFSAFLMSNKLLEAIRYRSHNIFSFKSV